MFGIERTLEFEYERKRLFIVIVCHETFSLVPVSGEIITLRNDNIKGLTKKIYFLLMVKEKVHYD